MYDTSTVRQEIYRGDIWMADLSKHEFESIQGKVRPVIIFSNYYNNKYSPNVNIIPLTSSTSKSQLPVHVNIGLECGVAKPSTALVEQFTVIPKNFLMYKVGQCTPEKIKDIERALRIQSEMPIDLSLINSLVNFINETDKFILNCLPKNVEELISSRSFRVSELRKYCFENYLDFEKLVGKKIIDTNLLIKMVYSKEGVGVAR
jgi:mRNA-degrading endonuclease toxin of MazEF toxin-antitoxin module